MIRKEFSVFLVVGTLTVLVDFLTYRSLLWLNLFNLNTAKALGFITGTIFAYFVNRLWTFGHKQHATGSMIRFALLYAATLSANVVINAKAYHWFLGIPHAFQLAFLIATVISAMLNFIGMKWFVFRTFSLKKKI